MFYSHSIYIIQTKYSHSILKPRIKYRKHPSILAIKKIDRQGFDFSRVSLENIVKEIEKKSKNGCLNRGVY